VISEIFDEYKSGTTLKGSVEGEGFASSLQRVKVSQKSHKQALKIKIPNSTSPGHQSSTTSVKIGKTSAISA
jgi:hypothetical protein